MAIDANISIDGKPRGRYDFPEKVPKKLSDLENDLFYVRKKYILHVTKDTIEDYPVVKNYGNGQTIRKYSDSTKITDEKYYTSLCKGNSVSCICEESKYIKRPDGIGVIGPFLIVVHVGDDTSDLFGDLSIDPGTYFIDMLSMIPDAKHLSIYYYETKTIDDSFINPKEAYAFDIANIDDRSEQSKAYIEWQKGRCIRLKNSDSYQDLIGAKDFGEYVSFYFLSVGEGAVQSVDSYNFYKEATQSN